MDYEVVRLQDSLAAGLAGRTNNAASDMGAVIGGLWERFYGAGVYAAIPHKVNDFALGIYTDYAGTERDDYTVLTACAVSDVTDMPAGVTVKKIPSGPYAKFIVKGPMHTAVAEFWQKLWRMDLPRSFVCDFEEYRNDDMEHAEIHMYIGLKR
ncbi:GyrI-like domain-containing protein [Treponema brennaborense]|uniref:Transcription activator effector binding protein n=1 Tax=Treponema brennaborense (strain DSM 12168 / CIP 105900 / DD5/3) TaxID=906968 RepID=F4LNN9_TREBD|nr:GyrI-like domain-containing protein [Treponema brennaborense]AEE16874.1 transcription activator effector binding protein [Treponema brennaborense DSM 12168]